MPILTKNETPAKGQKAEFELDKSALAAVTSVAADSYFSDDANWQSVEMIFKSNPGKQRRVVKFDATQAIPLTSFFASAKARDIFEIEKIIINDFDSGSLTVLRSELTVAEFDIDMGAVLPFYTVESGINDGFSSIGSIKVNNFFNGSTGQYVSSRANFSYNPNPAGMSDNQTYRFRFYLSSLTVVGTNFSMSMGGYSAAVTKTGVEVLSEFNTNGYIEFEYLSAAGYGIGPAIESLNQGESSFTVSKMEIYPI